MASSCPFKTFYLPLHQISKFFLCFCLISSLFRHFTNSHTQGMRVVTQRKLNFPALFTSTQANKCLKKCTLCKYFLQGRPFRVVFCIFFFRKKERSCTVSPVQRPRKQHQRSLAWKRINFITFSSIKFLCLFSVRELIKRVYNMLKWFNVQMGYRSVSHRYFRVFSSALFILHCLWDVLSLKTNNK